jgi:hypothetical protein
MSSLSLNISDGIHVGKYFNVKVIFDEGDKRERERERMKEREREREKSIL